jgi:hypothetical protein
VYARFVGAETVGVEAVPEAGGVPPPPPHARSPPRRSAIKQVFMVSPLEEELFPPNKYTHDNLNVKGILTTIFRTCLDRELLTWP